MSCESLVASVPFYFFLSARTCKLSGLCKHGLCMHKACCHAFIVACIETDVITNLKIQLVTTSNVRYIGCTVYAALILKSYNDAKITLHNGLGKIIIL